MGVVKKNLNEPEKPTSSPMSASENSIQFEAYKLFRDAAIIKGIPVAVLIEKISEVQIASLYNS